MAIGKAYMKAPQRMNMAERDAHDRHHHRHVSSSGRSHQHHHHHHPHQRAQSLLWLSHHGVAHVESHALSRHASVKQLVKSGLSREAAELKQRIKTTCPDTIMKFSFSCMRRVVTPPVAIPHGLASERALSTVVAGKRIPMTRAMWEKRKHQLERRLPDRIDEYLSW